MIPTTTSDVGESTGEDRGKVLGSTRIQKATGREPVMARFGV